MSTAEGTFLTADNLKILCDCGSGLRSARCCTLDRSATWPPVVDSDLASAWRAFQANDIAPAEQAVVALLERSPTSAGALLLLAELCGLSGRQAARELLLA